jgi:hypothetical protein
MATAQSNSDAAGTARTLRSIQGVSQTVSVGLKTGVCERETTQSRGTLEDPSSRKGETQAKSPPPQDVRYGKSDGRMVSGFGCRTAFGCVNDLCRGGAKRRSKGEYCRRRSQTVRMCVWKVGRRRFPGFGCRTGVCEPWNETRSWQARRVRFEEAKRRLICRSEIVAFSKSRTAEVFPGIRVAERR